MKVYIKFITNDELKKREYNYMEEEIITRKGKQLARTGETITSGADVLILVLTNTFRKLWAMLDNILNASLNDLVS